MSDPVENKVAGQGEKTPVVNKPAASPPAEKGKGDKKIKVRKKGTTVSVYRLESQLEKLLAEGYEVVK